MLGLVCVCALVGGLQCLSVSICMQLHSPVSCSTYVCVLYVPLSVPVSKDSVAPTIDKLVYYPEEGVEVVPGEYLVTVHPETDCECHMTVT